MTSGWANWSGRLTSQPRHRVDPATESGFVAAVEAARNRRVPIRAVGASHSHSTVAVTDGVLVGTDRWSGLLEIHAGGGGNRPRARFRSGTRIFEAGPLLFGAGLALINQGDIDKQSLAGAVSTGTHGTGPSLGSLSTVVSGLRLVLADGDVVDCGADLEPDLFAVGRMSLGAVGLITEVELQVRDRYRLHERQWLAPPAEVFDAIDELTGATRHFEFFWDPHRDRCACKSLAELPPGPDGDAIQPGGLPAPVVEPAAYERIGWSHQIISSIRDVRHTEMEYTVPADRGPACFAAVRELIGRRFGDLRWPVEYRTLAADDLMIGTTGGRAAVTISVHQDIDLDDRPLFQACEEVFLAHGGRPHWGKVHYLDGSALADLHPLYRRWWEIRDRYDPDGLFVTEALAALRP